MRRTLGLMFAMLVVIASAVLGFAILSQEVSAPMEPQNLVPCGSALMVVLDGHAQGGGEVRRPDDACVSEAREQIWWAAVPAVTGLLALGYLGFRWMVVVREAKEKSRPHGTVTT